MKDVYSKAFDGRNVDECLKVVSEAKIEIYEHDELKCSCIRETENEPVHFTIHNTNKSAIHFLAIDNCILNTQDEVKRCDFVFSDLRKICFVELKNARKNRGERRKEANAQLESTISHFKSKLDLSPYHLEAFLAVGNLKHTRPAFNASNQNAKLYFREKYAVELYEGNEVRLTA